MKAVICELWETGLDIITTGSDSNEIQSLADLKKCDNVLIGDRLPGLPYYEVMVDNSIFTVAFRSVTHPTGCGKLHVCQIQ